MANETYTDRFTRGVEAFLVQHGMSASAFGRESTGDPKFVSELRNGRSPRLAMADNITAWMREYERTASD